MQLPWSVFLFLARCVIVFVSLLLCEVRLLRHRNCSSCGQLVTGPLLLCRLMSFGVAVFVVVAAVSS